MEPGITCRPATAGDVGALHELIVAIARHHDQLQHVRTSVADLMRDGFGQNSKFAAVLAEDRGMAVGYASYTWNYSIWLAATYMNIDDVYVMTSHRGLGVGERLLLELRRVARDRGAVRLRWEVQSDNAGAIRFYERIGAVMRTKGIFTWDAL